MNRKPTALSLRSTLYRPNEIVDFAQIAEDGGFAHLFFPDIPQGYDSLVLSASASAATKRIRLGPGVMRPLEHDQSKLARMVATLQFLSANRFVLGIGTGNAGTNPGDTVDRMLAMVNGLKMELTNKFANVEPPLIYVGALRQGIAKRVIGTVDGLILNFCSPEYASRLVTGLSSKISLHDKIVACYIKIFYAKREGSAKRLLIEEFANYDRMPNYHKMFQQDGISDDVAKARSDIENIVASGEVPKSLLGVSLVNPSPAELHDLIQRFRESGVNLPCVYPYFALDEDSSFKQETIRSVGSAL